MQEPDAADPVTPSPPITRRFSLQPEYQAISYAYGNDAEMEFPELLYLRYDFRLHNAADPSIRPPVGTVVRLGDFDCTFEDKQLFAQPRRLFRSWEEGRDALAPHLERWEMFSELTGRGRLTFFLRHFALSNYTEGAEGPRDCVATLGDWAGYEPPQPLAREFSQPAPPTFVVTPLLRRLQTGFRDVQELRTSPLVEGYFLLTALEREFGDGQVSRKDRLSAAEALNVHIDVLDLLGDVTAADDQMFGRKVGKPGKVRVRPITGPATREERRWTFLISQDLMLRLADVENRRTLLTLAHESPYRRPPVS